MKIKYWIMVFLWVFNSTNFDDYKFFLKIIILFLWFLIVGKKKKKYKKH